MSPGRLAFRPLNQRLKVILVLEFWLSNYHLVYYSVFHATVNAITSTNSKLILDQWLSNYHEVYYSVFHTMSLPPAQRLLLHRHHQVLQLHLCHQYCLHSAHQRSQKRLVCLVSCCTKWQVLGWMSAGLSWKVMRDLSLVNQLKRTLSLLLQSIWLK